MSTHRRTAAALVAAVALALPVAPATAHGSTPSVSDPIVSGLTTPLGLAIGRDGTVYVAQAFAGLVTAVDRKGRSRTIAKVDPETSAIAGVAAGGRGTVSYVVTGTPPQQVFTVLPNGRRKLVGTTSDIELGSNPDGKVTYGFTSLPPGCEASLPAEMQPASYPGDVNPNAYAVAILRDGSRVVADAGGNTLILVRANRAPRVLAVLPPVRVKITAQAAGLLGLPECTVGATYRLHAVPTDVEVGPDGMLYVSSLAGGPEDPAAAAALGGPGGVFRVNPRTGKVTRIAKGFLGAVDLAVSPSGSIYVAELYAGRISKVVRGGPRKVVDLPGPGALEWARGKLYATTNAFPPVPGAGAVVTIRP